MTVPSDIIFTPTSIQRVGDISKKHKGPNIKVTEERGRRDSQEDTFAYGLIDRTLLSSLSPEEKMQRFWTLTKHLHEATEKLQPKTKAGSTASIVIFDGTCLYVVSLGDSTVFATDKNNPTKVVRLNSNLHKPYYSKEAKYIDKEKGTVYDERLYNNLGESLNLSRTFGDLSYVNHGLNTSPTIDIFDLATLRQATGSAPNSDIHIISACDGLTEKAKVKAEVAASQTNTAEKEAQEDFVLEHLKTIHKKPNASITEGLAQAATDSGSRDNLSIAVHTLTEGTPPFYMAIFDGHGLKKGHEVSSQAARWFGILLRECLSLTKDQYLQDTFCTQNHQAEFDADHNPDNEDKPENNDYRRLCSLKNFIHKTPLPQKKAIKTTGESKSVDQPVVAEPNIPNITQFETERNHILSQVQQMQWKFSKYSEITYLTHEYLCPMYGKQLEQIRELLHLIIYNLNNDADISFMQNKILIKEFTDNIYSIQRLVIDLGITFQQLAELSPETRLELYDQQLALFYLIKDGVVPKGQLNQFLESTVPKIRKEIYANARILAAFFENHKPKSRSEYGKEYYQDVFKTIKTADIYAKSCNVTANDAKPFTELTQVNLAPQLESNNGHEEQPEAVEPMIRAEQKAEQAPSNEFIAQRDTEGSAPQVGQPTVTPMTLELVDELANLVPKTELVHESKEQLTDATQPVAEQKTKKPSSDEAIAQFKEIIKNQNLSDKARQKLTKLADTLNSSYKKYAKALHKYTQDYNEDEPTAEYAEFNAAQQALKDYIYSSQATLGTKLVNAGKVLLTFFKVLGFCMLLAALASVPVGLLFGIPLAFAASSPIALGFVSSTIVLTFLGGVVGSAPSWDAAEKKYGDLKCSFFTSRIGKNSGESQAIENLLTDIDINKLQRPAS